MLRSLAIILGLVCALAAPPRATAAPDATQQHVDEGARLFKAGDYDAALLEFTRAHAQSNDAKLLYLIARCHEERARWKEALAAYEGFLAAEVPADARGRAEAAIRVIKERLATGRLFVNVSPFGAEVLLDGVPLGAAPVAPQTVTPGKHRVTARTAAGGAETREVDVPAGGEATVALVLAEAAPLPGPTPLAPAEGPRRPYHPWQWVTFGTGLGVAGLGGLLVGLGQMDYDDYVDGERRDGDLRTSGYAKNITGYTFVALGGAALVTSVVLFVLDAGRQDAGAPPVSGAAISLTPGGAVFGLEGGF